MLNIVTQILNNVTVTYTVLLISVKILNFKGCFENHFKPYIIYGKNHRVRS